MIRFILFRMLFGDPEGAEVLNIFKKLFNAQKELDDKYHGPQYYWAFSQLGQLGQQNLSLVRWEIWSSWKEDDKLEPLIPGYVGASCALFVYFIDLPETWNTTKIQIDRFFERQKKEMPVSLVVGLYNSTKYSKKQLIERPDIKEQMDYIKKKRGDILFVPDKFAETQNFEQLFNGFCTYFISKLDPKLAGDFNLMKEMKYLDLHNVQHLLIAEKRGWNQARLDDYLHPKKIEGPGETWEIPAKSTVTTTQDVKSETPTEAPPAVQPVVVEDGKILGTHEVVSPEGEKITVSDLTEAKLVELDMQGYQIPEVLRAVIPRHCPKCGNYNQRMIFERTDKNLILLDYPRIYGLKCVCGNCGNEWHQN
jgi:hypothetical protein